MKEVIKSEIKNKFLPVIQSWRQEDIYAISFYVSDMEDNPCKPTVSLSYNREEEVQKNLKYTDEPEARWNYAFWPQNIETDFGYDKVSGKLIKDWIKENQYPYKSNYNPFDTNSEQIKELQVITSSFVEILIEIVEEIHNSGILKEKFGKEIPIIIHELEYYDTIAQQNIKANGPELVKDFCDFIDSMNQQYIDYRFD